MAAKWVWYYVTGWILDGIGIILVMAGSLNWSYEGNTVGVFWGLLLFGVILILIGTTLVVTGRRLRWRHILRHHRPVFVTAEYHVHPNQVQPTIVLPPYASMGSATSNPVGVMGGTSPAMTSPMSAGYYNGAAYPVSSFNATPEMYPGPPNLDSAPPPYAPPVKHK